MLKEKHSYIGLIIFLSAIILFVGLNFLKGKDLFKNSNTYYVKYSNISGLKKSNPVSLLGFEIGKVDDIYFDEEDPEQVIVKLEIDKTFKIPNNSAAKISSASLLGNKEIVLILSNEGTYLKDSEFLIGQNEESMMALLNTKFEPLSNKAHRLFISMDILVSSINEILDSETRTNISKSLKHIEGVTYNVEKLLDNKSSNFNQLLDNLESITNNIGKNNTEITKIISNFALISDSLANSNITAILNGAGKTIAGLNQIIENINGKKGSLGKLIYKDSLYNNLNNSSKSLNSLLVDIEQNPKKYIHFSLFDKGKTSFYNKIPYNNDLQYYSICILETDNILNKTDKLHSRFKNLKLIKTNKTFLYTVERTSKLKLLNKKMEKINKDFPKAKIINTTYL